MNQLPSSAQSRAYVHVVDAICGQYLGCDGQQHLSVDKAVPEHGTIRFERLGRHPVTNLLHRPVHDWNLVDFGGWVREVRGAILRDGQVEFAHDEDSGRVHEWIGGTCADSKSSLRKSYKPVG